MSNRMPGRQGYKTGMTPPRVMPNPAANPAIRTAAGFHHQIGAALPTDKLSAGQNQLFTLCTPV